MKPKSSSKATGARKRVRGRQPARRAGGRFPRSNPFSLLKKLKMKRISRSTSRQISGNGRQPSIREYPISGPESGDQRTEKFALLKSSRSCVDALGATAFYASAPAAGAPPCCDDACITYTPSCTGNTHAIANSAPSPRGTGGAKRGLRLLKKGFQQNGKIRKIGFTSLSSRILQYTTRPLQSLPFRRDPL